MKYTLLEIVQDILNDMDSDSVNSINDTVESQQVAQIVRTCFNEMISNRNWPHLKKLIPLSATTDNTKPSHMRLPVGVKEIEFIRYDKRKLGETRNNYKEIRYKNPEAFLELISQRNSDNTTVSVITDFNGTVLNIQNDVAPTYWTSFDDSYIVFDSYDSAVDDTLRESKSQISAYVEPTWVHEDEAVPNLPDEAFAALVEEAKSTSFFAIKQMANQKAEQKAARQQRWLSRKAWRAKGGVNYEDYGRKGRR